MEKYAKKIVYHFEFTDSNDDICESRKLHKLGHAMFKFYQGEELTFEQIELIANSSPAQQINAMNIVARQLLFYGNNRSAYLSYDKSCNMLLKRKKMKK